MPETMLVKATELNLRQSPDVANANRIAVLPQGHVVEIVERTNQDWCYVKTTVSSSEVWGFVATRYLARADSAARVRSAELRVHMPVRPHSRRNVDGARAYPLSEAAMPSRTGTTGAERVRELNEIVDWINVETALRHLPKAGITYCNIYAYDYVYLAGAYLPRVWWVPHALSEVLAGRAQPVLYGTTVRELRANDLFDWLQDFGSQLGWRRVLDLSAAQNAANDGAIVILCAQRVAREQPGHINVIVPEGNGSYALRNAQGQLTAPLQSQAGGTNFKRRAQPNWWRQAKFRAYSIWVHD